MDGHVFATTFFGPTQWPTDLPGQLALFAVDFANNTCRSRAGSPAAPCGSEGAFRGRSLAGSPSDMADRLRIHADLAAVGLALRP
jgi:hypothetical protein